MKKIKLYAHCKLIKGYNQSLIYDIQRHVSYKIDNEIVKLIQILQKTSFSDFIQNNKNKKAIVAFVNYLIENEIIFMTDVNDEKFQEIKLQYESPYIITNAEIEIKTDLQYNYEKLISNLNQLKCKAVKLIFDCDYNFNKVKKHIKIFNFTTIASIDILIKYNIKLKESELTTLLNKFPRIRLIKIFNSDFNKTLEFKDSFYNEKINYTKKTLSEINNSINIIYNTPVFVEAHNRNVGLNQKVAIMGDGTIKNSIFHLKEFGNINNIELNSIVKNNEFQEKWNITNDKIVQCQDCQYRYACISNSDIIYKNKKYYKKDKCNFNPYKNLWDEPYKIN